MELRGVLIGHGGGGGSGDEQGKGEGRHALGGGAALATALSSPLNPPDEEGLDVHRLRQWACVRVESRVEARQPATPAEPPPPHAHAAADTAPLSAELPRIGAQSVRVSVLHPRTREAFLDEHQRRSKQVL